VEVGGHGAGAGVGATGLLGNDAGCYVDPVLYQLRLLPFPLCSMARSPSQMAYAEAQRQTFVSSDHQLATIKASKRKILVNRSIN